MGFKGDTKTGTWLLARQEDRLKAWLLPKVPARIETYHLTLSTVLWSALIVVFSFLAKHDIRWLWLSSLMIFLQYITDLLDGAVGRARDTGLVKWGYYMDHFLDYVFLCSILIGYSLLLPGTFKSTLFFVMAFFGAFMVNSFLSFAATNEFKISYLGIGPTEVRIVFILVNTLLILFGRTYMLRALPYVLTLATFGLFVTVYRTQRELWDVDMQAKRGVEPSRVGRAAMAGIAREFAEGLSVRRIVRNVALSLIVAAIAFVQLVMRIGFPYHRPLFLLIYAAGWVPFFLSFRRKRALLRREGKTLRKELRPYVAHVLVAVSLVVVARAAWVLTPAEVASLAEMTSGELRDGLRSDFASLRIVRSHIGSLLDWAGATPSLSRPAPELTPEDKEQVQSFWRRFLQANLELEIVKKRYRGFYHLDYIVKPQLHAEAFLAAYAAFVTQYGASTRLADTAARSPYLDRALDEEDPAHGIPAGTFTGVRERLTHPDELLRLNAGAAYLLLVKKDLGEHAALVEEVRGEVRAVLKTLGRDPARLLEAPIALVERVASSVWFPFQKEVAIQMSQVHPEDREKLITPSLLARHKHLLQPGDVLFERRNWHLTNAGIPGFWPHTAFYVGTPAQMDAYFAGVVELKGMKASAYLAAKYPSAWAAVDSTDKAGRRLNVIEALRDGVVFNSLEVSAHADYLAVLRPRISGSQKFRAVCEAFAQHGKPYDYDFDFATDSALVCSELVYKSFRVVPDLNMELTEMNGRAILPANTIIQGFDEDYGTWRQRFDFVLFLDSREKERRVVVADVEALRASWKRPKWEVLLD